MDYEEPHTVPGSIPEFGAIFISNIETKRECLRKKIFGLPTSHASFVDHIKAGMVLFLFEFERRELHGVFQACSDGAMNIVPNAFSSSGKQFPAQVKFFPLWKCSPLSEKEFGDAIRENYFSPKKFHFGLSKDQVHRLLYLFNMKKLKGQGPQRHLSENRFSSSRGYAMRKVRRVGASDRSFRSDQVTSDHKTDNNHENIISTMFHGDYFCNFERSIGASNRNERSVGVGSIGERDPDDGRLATNLDFSYEHKVDSSFANKCFNDSFTRVGEAVDTSRLAAASGRAGNEWNVETDVKPSFSVEYALDNFKRASEDVRLIRNDCFESEDYRNNASALPFSPASPSFSHVKLNPSPVSLKYVMEDNSFKHDPAPVPSSTFLHPTEPLSSKHSQPAVYGDAVVTSTLLYDPDVPYLDYQNASSLGVIRCSRSLPESAADNNHADHAIPTQKRILPSGSSSCMLTDVGIRSSNCCPALFGDMYGGRTSLSESAYCKNRGSELMNEGYGDYSYRKPSLSHYFSECRDDVMKSENLLSCSAQHNAIYSSINFGCGYSASSKDVFDRNLPKHGKTAEFVAANRASKKHQHLLQRSSFVESKSLDYCRNNSLDPTVLKNSETHYLDCKKNRGSVFSRLSLAPKVLKETSDYFHYDVDQMDSSVDEVMAVLQHNHQQWAKTRSKPVTKVSNSKESFRMMPQIILNSKASTNMSACTSMKMDIEGISYGEENGSEKAEQVPFLDFKRRNVASKNLCDSKNGGCSRSAEVEDPSVGQHKRRKLVRPDFSKTESCENWDTNNSFAINEGHWVQGLLSGVGTRTIQDSVCHDDGNKISQLVKSPHVMQQTCTEDENLDTPTKQVENIEVSISGCVEEKDASVEQHKRRRLVRPNFDKSKLSQETDRDDAAKIGQIPMTKFSATKNEIGSIKVSEEVSKCKLSPSSVSD